MLLKLAALLPLLSLIYLLLIKGEKLLIAARRVAILTFFLVFFNWQVSYELLFSAHFKALCLTIDIFLIVLGALFFQDYLKSTGNFKMMIDELNKVTSSRWLLILILSWCFGAFLEGISGFGAPAALLAPILVGLGLLPLEAIVICLLANSTSVTFGAMGTAFRVGLSPFLTPELISNTALMNLAVGGIIPMLMVHFLRRRKLAPSDSLIPYLWAVIAGLSLLVPYYLMSFYALEFPTVIGGGVGFFVMIFILKIKEKRDFSLKKLLWSFYPYWPVICLLFVGRFLFSGKGFKIALGDNFNHSFNYFHPGLILLLVVVVLGRFHFTSFHFLKPIFKKNKNKLWQTTLSLFFMGLISTLFLVTEFSQKRGMLSLIGDMLEGEYYRYYAVFLGALGSFLTGSATVSNLLFGPLQVQISSKLSLDQDLILALQLSGGAMGNMVSLLNIISVEGALGVTLNLKMIFKYLLPYFICTLFSFAFIQALF